MSRQSKMWNRHHVRSGFEQRIKERLNSISGIRFEYEDRKYKYIKKTCPHCNEVTDRGTYTPDFNFYGTDGSYIFTVEAKGLFRADDRKKLLAVREADPTIDLRILFQRDQAIRKGSKTRYSTWAEKHKFDFDFGDELPERWIRDAINE